MQAVGFVIPLLPGKTDTDRAALASCWRGERKAAYEDARRRAGVTREAAWIQSAPTGDMAVIYLEADDLTAAMDIIVSSDEPFDRWFRQHILEVHGVALEEGFPPPEQVLDFRAEIPL
jgi:hypothetical protein